MKNIYKILYGLVSTVVFMGYKIESWATNLRLTITSSAVVTNCSSAEYPETVRGNIDLYPHTTTWCRDNQYLAGCTSGNGTFVSWSETGMYRVCQQNKNYECGNCADLPGGGTGAKNMAGDTYIAHYQGIDSTFTTCGTQYFSGGMGTADNVFALKTDTSRKRVYYRLTNGDVDLRTAYMTSCYLPVAESKDAVGTFSMISECYFTP